MRLASVLKNACVSADVHYAGKRDEIRRGPEANRFHRRFGRRISQLCHRLPEEVELARRREVAYKSCDFGKNKILTALLKVKEWEDYAAHQNRPGSAQLNQPLLGK